VTAVPGAVRYALDEPDPSRLDGAAAHGADVVEVRVPRGGDGRADLVAAARARRIRVVLSLDGAGLTLADAARWFTGYALDGLRVDGDAPGPLLRDLALSVAKLAGDLGRPLTLTAGGVFLVPAEGGVLRTLDDWPPSRGGSTCTASRGPCCSRPPRA
jgi:hypothetical protein